MICKRKRGGGGGEQSLYSDVLDQHNMPVSEGTADLILLCASVENNALHLKTALL